jgi:(E)-2-((N-methylformamido)methylene)succinate hydrolase
MSLAIASEIDGAKTVIVPGLQHLGLLERPDLFIQPILQFLAGVTTQSHEVRATA